MKTKLRPYQLRAIAALESNRRGIIHAPAGSGKTIIAAAALADFAATLFEKQKAFWICNTNEQREQAEQAIDNFLVIRRRLELTICCYATVPDCSAAAIIIFDECHHIASPEYRKCLDGVSDRTIKLGFSATPYRTDDLRNDVFQLIGPILATIHRDELIDAGNLAKARVLFHQPCFSGEIQKKVEDASEPLIRQRLRFWKFVSQEDIRKRTIWQLVQKHGIFENAKRNSAIIGIARDHADDSQLILVGSIEHGELFQRSIPGSVVAHSKMGAKNRRAAMDAFRAGELKCVIATSLADEGLDLPRANVLILAAGGRSAAKTEQRTGRVLRTWSDKTHGQIHDFWDTQHFFTLAQSKARHALYRELGYEVEFKEARP